MLIRSDCLRGMELDELLKQMTFTRSEFEYLAGLLQSRTVGYNTLQAEVSNIKQTRSSEKENGSRGLPVDFSIRSYSVADQVASPAEIAKAYMGSICPEGSPLRLRLHDPSTLTNKLVEASTVAKSPNPPLFRSSRLSASTPFDRLGSNYMTPNKSAIHKISSSPYFKGPVPSRDMSGTVSSSYQTSNSVHTFGRQQILKRKSIALNNETVSVGPIRKMRQRYNRVSPLLETRPGYRGYLGSHASKLDEDSEHSTQIQKRQCLAKVDNDTRGACGNTFGQAPPQSTEMAAKILKQLDTLAPSQKEGTSEIKQRHRNAIDVDDSNSQRKEILSQCSVLKSTSALNQEYSVLNSVNVAAKFTPAAIDGKSVDAISERSTVLESKSSSELVTSPEDSLEVDNCSRSIVALHQSKDTIEKIQPAIQEHTAKSPGTTNKDNPPTLSLQSHSPNLVLSSEIDRSVMSASSNGFSFPVTAALGAHSQAPPTPTMASPPTLAVGKDKSAGPSLPVTSAEGAPWISKQVSEEGSVSNKHVKKLNGEIPPISSKSAGHVASFTINPVFNVINSKPTTLSNGPTDSVFSTDAGSSTSLPQFSFQPGFQTSSTSTQQSGGIQFKAAPDTPLPFSMQSNSTGGSFTFSNTGPSSSLTSSKIPAGTTSQSAGAPPSGSSNAPFNFSPKFGGASFLAAQDKSKTGSSSTPLKFSAQFGSVSSVTSLDKSKVTSSDSAMLSGNQCAQSGNSNLWSTQSSASKSNLMSSEKSNMASLPSFVNSQFSSAPSSSSPFSSIVSFTAASGLTSVNATPPLSSPATSSTLGSSKAFSSSPIFGSNLITTASPFGIPNAGSAIPPFSSTSSAVFSFTSSTPAVPTSSPSTPNPSPSTTLFGSMSPTIGSSRGTDQMNGVHIAGESNQSPFSTTPPFGFQSNSPSTPVFSTPATQFASTTSTASPGIFQFGQQSQASAAGFSMGSIRDNDKSGRRILKVKRKK
ncbi:unnamed protein product [Alopecurus aequalis]